jgi:hypothetical protein
MVNNEHSHIVTDENGIELSSATCAKAKFLLIICLVLRIALIVYGELSE